MRTLYAKEVVPMLAPAAVAAAGCFAGLRVLLDARDVFLAAPSDALALVALLACAFGAMLGLQQLHLEHERETLSYLLHRDAGVGRVLLAKCLAAWTALALVLAAPLVLAYALDRATSPFGPVLQPARLVELLLACTLAVPAHALGLFAAGLRGARLVRFGALAVAALGLLLGVGLATWLPLGPVAARLWIGLALAGLSLVLLRAARARLVLAGDPERAPRPSEIAAALLVVALVVGPPIGLALSGLQVTALDPMLDRRAPIAWHAQLGAAVAERVDTADGSRWRMRGADGEVVDELHARPDSSRWVSLGPSDTKPEALMPARAEAEAMARKFEREQAEREWTVVWEPDGALLDDLRIAGPYGSFAAAPNVAPAWDPVYKRTGYAAGHLIAPAPEPVVLEVFRDRAGGRFLALTARTEPADGAPRRTFRIIEPRLDVLVRGDGRRFSQDTTASHLGRRSAATASEITAYDPSDRTTWKWNVAARSEGFRLADDPRPRRTPEDDARPELGQGTWAPGSVSFPGWPPVRAIVSGDRLTSTVRVVDAHTGDLLLEHRYALEGPREHVTAALLFASELLRPPLRTAHAWLVLPPDAAVQVEIREAGLLSVAGHRGSLVLANAALALALALWARARLARRGAGRARVATWMIAIAALGPSALAALLLLEPLRPAGPSAEPRSEPARRTPRRPAPLVESAASEAVPR